MKIQLKNLEQLRRRRFGMTVAEFMVAVALGSIVLAVTAALSMYGLRSFVAIGNYTDLNEKSRTALDQISRDLRECTSLTNSYDMPGNRWLLFVNPQGLVKLEWNLTDRTLVTTKITATGSSAKTNLVECDYWNYQLNQQTPTWNTTNKFGVFIFGTNRCKLVNMTWKCSRTMLGKKWQTESVQTAKIVLRNAR